MVATFISFFAPLADGEVVGLVVAGLEGSARAGVVVGGKEEKGVGMGVVVGTKVGMVTVG